MFGDGASTMKIEGWESNARFLYGTLDADGRPLRAISVQSNFVRYDGKVLHESTEAVDRSVWQRAVSSPTTNRFTILNFDGNRDEFGQSY
jgi:hypothetical protein